MLDRELLKSTLALLVNEAMEDIVEDANLLAKARIDAIFAEPAQDTNGGGDRFQIDDERVDALVAHIRGTHDRVQCEAILEGIPVATPATVATLAAACLSSIYLTLPTMQQRLDMADAVGAIAHEMFSLGQELKNAPAAGDDAELDAELDAEIAAIFEEDKAA